jgi:hypothetical protein
MSNAITDLLAAVESGTGVPAGVLADEVVLDATVPSWRMTVRGADAVRDRYAVWFADAGHFESLERTAIPAGEAVRFLLTWVEAGVPHAAHQAHFFELDATGRIVRDEMYCGGRWDAGLLAEMEAADRASV